MANPGSIFWAWRNASLASSYSKLCRAATPRRKYGCASADPEVGNVMTPKPRACVDGCAPSARRRQTSPSARVSDFIDGDLARVEEEIEASRAHGGIVHAEHDLIPSGRLRPPEMRPERPVGRRHRHRAVVDRRPRLIRLEPDLQRVAWFRSAPEHADKAIDDAPGDHPLLYPHRHRRGVDYRRRELTRELRLPVLMRAPGELNHLRRRRRIVCHDVNLIHPFDAGAAIPSRHDETDRKPVIAWQRRPVYARREKCRGA